MNPRYLILLTTLAFLGFSSSALMAKPEKCDDWPNCPNPDPDVTATYTAQLTGGYFVFETADGTGILTGLTTNSRGTALSGDFDIKMSQVSPVYIYDESACPDGPVPCPDDPVFVFNYHCPDFLEDPVPVTFYVAAGNWGIAHIGAKGTPGHVYIVTRNLENITLLNSHYSKADFDFDLHGDVDEGDLFPPETTTEILLTEYKLWAGVGGREKILCNSDDRPALLSEIELVITRE